MRTENERWIWFDGKLMKVQDAKIGVLCPSTQFGANVFEGIRCYWNEEYKQLYAFRLEEHFKRLQNSMKLFKMENPYSKEALEHAFFAVIRKNEYQEDIAVRQTVLIDGLGTWSSRGPINMFVAPIPKSRIRNLQDSSISCGVSTWERISDRNMSPRIKVGANYINSRMAQLEALERGYDSAIFLNSAGKVAEGPGSCLFIIREKKILTAPLNASILESITRDTIIKLATDLGYEVIEREIERTELYIADEAFLCGSAMEITPIKSIDGYIIGKHGVGIITNKLHKKYLDVVTGNASDYCKWLTPIYE